MNSHRIVSETPRVKRRFGWLRNFSMGVSLVGFYLFGIGAFFLVAAFIKGVQVLVFVPALFLGIFAFSYFETRKITRTVRFTLEKDRDSYRIFVRAAVPVGLAFRIGFRDALGNVEFSDADTETFSVAYPANGSPSVELHFRGSFDLFRKIVRLGKLPPAAGTLAGVESATDSYAVSRRVGWGDFVGKIDALRSSVSDVPYSKSWEASSLPSSSGAVPVPKEIAIRSNVPISLPNASAKARSIEWQLVALCSAIVALQWESWAFLWILAGTFGVLYALQNFLNVRSLPKGVKTAAIFACFLLMAEQSWHLYDLMGPVCVFLMQILVIHFFYPDDRDESFLYIFLSLFVFATVSFLSISVWFLLFFAVLLFGVLRLLFLSSGYLGQESTFRPVKTEVDRAYLIKAFATLYAATLAFFAVLPHGDGIKSISLPSVTSSDVAVSGLKSEIGLGGLLNIKKDSSKKVVLRNVSAEQRIWLEQAYWKGERFTDFDGSKWLPESDPGYRYVPNAAGTENAVSITYYDPGSRMVPVPGVLAAASVGDAYRGNRLTVRESDSTVLRTQETMGSAYEVSAVFDRSVSMGVSFSGASAALEPSVEKLLAPYWTGIDVKTSKNPLELARYVRDRSGFSYSTDAPAKNLRSFLYEEKRGHCEYFATVLALTLRHFGYPATVVNGYYSGEYSRLSDSWIIRGEEAHAWVEVPTDKGWIIYDATPNSGVVVRSTFDELKNVAVSAYDFADLAWFTYVVGYSGTAQKDLFLALLGLWPWALGSALFVLVVRFAARAAVLRYRHGKLSSKERFLADFQKLAGGDFPLSRFEDEHAALVQKTRRAVFGGFWNDGEFIELSRLWKSALKRKGR